MPTRISFNVGHADFDDFDVEYGETTAIPRRIDVTFPGVGDQPSLHMRLELVDGVPECQEIRVTATEGGREVRTKDLEAIKVREWTDDIYAACTMPIRRNADGTIVMSVRSELSDPLPVLKAFTEVRRKNARRLNRSRLREAAQVYVDNLDGDPIFEVAERFDIKPRTASDWITKARAEGILSPTDRGKKGGHLLDPDGDDS